MVKGKSAGGGEEPVEECDRLGPQLKGEGDAKGRGGEKRRTVVRCVHGSPSRSLITFSCHG